MGGLKNDKANKGRAPIMVSESFTRAEKQIAKWQERKERRQQNRPAKELVFDKRYLWAIDGVDDSNREQWKRAILKKNPWMDSSVFNQAEAKVPMMGIMCPMQIKNKQIIRCV